MPKDRTIPLSYTKYLELGTKKKYKPLSKLDMKLVNAVVKELDAEVAHVHSLSKQINTRVRRNKR